MKQLLVLSGKGGTGKTTVAGAFIALSKVQAFADCDIDAPNLHLVINPPSEAIKKPFYGMDKAKINQDVCIGCGKCESYCRFDAISMAPYQVIEHACEGCGVCKVVCPVNAIEMFPDIAGELRQFNEPGYAFSTATLKMGSGNSGKMVTEVKKQMKQSAGDAPLAIIDGSPGIGCPVIASISGVDMVLIVAEPSLSGISDMQRIMKTIYQFKVKPVVCVNKADVNLVHTEQIESYCSENHIPFVGTIPFDSKIIEAVNRGETVESLETPGGQAIRAIYSQTMALMESEA